MSRLKVFLLAAAVALTPFLEASAAKGSSGGGRSYSSPSRSYSAPSRPSYQAPSRSATPPPSAPSKPSPSFGSFGSNKSSAPAPAAPVQRAAPQQASTPAAAPAPRPSFGSFGGRSAAIGAGAAAVGAASVMSNEPKPAPSSNSALNRGLDSQSAQANSIKSLNQREASKAAAAAPAMGESSGGRSYGRDYSGGSRAATPPVQQQPQVATRESGGISPITAGVLGYMIGNSGNAAAQERAERDRRIETERRLEASERQNSTGMAGSSDANSENEQAVFPNIADSNSSYSPSSTQSKIESAVISLFPMVLAVSVVLVTFFFLLLFVLRNRRESGSIKRKNRYSL